MRWRYGVPWEPPGAPAVPAVLQIVASHAEKRSDGRACQGRGDMTSSPVGVCWDMCLCPKRHKHRSPTYPLLVPDPRTHLITGRRYNPVHIPKGFNHITDPLIHHDRSIDIRPRGRIRTGERGIRTPRGVGAAPHVVAILGGIDLIVSAQGNTGCGGRPRLDHPDDEDQQWQDEPEI
jgi:hypothetical protein